MQDFTQPLLMLEHWFQRFIDQNIMTIFEMGKAQI